MADNVLNALSPASNSKESFAFDGAKIQIPFFTNKFFLRKNEGECEKTDRESMLLPNTDMCHTLTGRLSVRLCHFVIF